MVKPRVGTDGQASAWQGATRAPAGGHPIAVLANLSAMVVLLVVAWPERLGALPQTPRDASGVLSEQSPRSVALLRGPEPLRRSFDPGGILPVPGGNGGPGQGESFLSSLIVPGLGQYRLGTRRWIAYAGLEAVAAFLYLDSRSDARGLRVAYRNFAWDMARLGSSQEPRLDGDFLYYEVLSKWRSSGAWDADPALDGLQPERDPTTYNGSIWALAAEIFAIDARAPGGSAAYARALDYYRSRGYGPAFLWAWGEGTGDQDHFGGLIVSSDERFRDARRALWIVAANHLLGAIDGFITARLRALPEPGGVGVTLAVAVPGGRW